ncbi:putative gamma-glutamylcyclotransferase At3g02910 [Dioscorea cayenensis subsp. rotundata]|uniref:Gamma-glutamylcyclotransferase family protein n=1 Tax=Dioscorea cayennensis subsp. rotundata TaxID=55577 RepID=A0AB40B6M0_DIOCR|nr:putative gamma-glutamylcyclotransferase At3g02910 [Dioscorea cayenensis subsp. rotundata]
MAAEEKWTVIFTYGTLKRGFSNHVLMQDLILAGNAIYLGHAITVTPLPLVCGPYSVPFLLNLPGAGDKVRGELYSVSPRALIRLDELEGTLRGHYERLPISIREEVQGREGEGEIVKAEAYYAHRSYAEQLWSRNGMKGLCCYSEKEVLDYVKRKDRPQDITFLDQIRIFIASSAN